MPAAFQHCACTKAGIEFKTQKNKKNPHDAAYCMRTDNQEDSSVYHYFGITNGKEVLEMISGIPEQQAFFLLISAFLF